MKIFRKWYIVTVFIKLSVFFQRFSKEQQTRESYKKSFILLQKIDAHRYGNTSILFV